jgi:hypothetical protein
MRQVWHASDNSGIGMELGASSKCLFQVLVPSACAKCLCPAVTP